MTQPNANPQPHNILIVDDTPASLRLLAQMLADHGYQVRPVTEGSMALAAAQAQPPDLILLDIRMPGMNGYQVCGRLKADPLTRDIPVIFISALDEIQDKVQAFATGGVDYVTKPYQLEEVLARVQAHLTLRRLQRELQEANQRMEQELALAGEVQAGFLPKRIPVLAGWQLAAALLPARQTSGDFYDLIPLPNGELGILVADVVDKGVEAALFMALSWSLVRTYARDHPSHPGAALSAVNSRIIGDTRSGQFLSAFYAVIKPHSGELIYCNAGHCPGILARSGPQASLATLEPTGMLLGVSEDGTWHQRQANLDSGDVLVLYTDGATDAENGAREFFGTGRLAACVRDHRQSSAQEILDALLAAIQDFVGDQNQFDDIAILVVKQAD